MHRPTKTVFMQYGGAFFVTALAVGLWLLLYPWLGDSVLFMTLFGAAAVFAAWFGGRGTALLALRDAEQRWRTLAEALPNLVWTDLPNGQCDWLSSQWGKYTGIPENELLGLQWVEKVLHPDDRERTLACWVAACADEGDYDIEYRIRRHDGEYRWFKTRGVPMRDEQGKIVYWFGTCTDIEDNKRLEEAFRRQQAVLTMAETAARIGHFEWDISNDDNRWSPELEALYGLPPGGFGGGHSGWRKLAHPDDLAVAEVAVQESLSTGRLQAEFRAIWPDGTVRWLEARAIVSKDDNGRPVRMVGINMDVTDRKRIEEEERAGRERLRMALTAARMVAWELNPTTGVVVTSENAAELVGLPRGEMITDPERGLALIHPDDAQRQRATMMKALEECGAYVSHFRMIRRDNGEVIWLEERGQAISENPPRAARLVGVTMDVTERKQQEIRFKDSEERLSAVIEAIPQVVWTAKTNDEVDFASRRWYDYTGRTPEQTLGTAWAAALHPDDLEQTAAKWQAALATSEPTEIEYRLRAADGRYRWQLIRGVPLKNCEGQVLKWFGTITDIHDRKQAEQELQENDRRKDEFLATLAHELRNPLAPIRNGLQVMRMASANPVVVEQARSMMERQLRQMVRLVDDLLDVSRINSGKLELKREQVSLAAVLNSAIETSRPLIDQMGHELTVMLPKQSVVVEADLTRLAQVFLNLLNNAAKYSDQGGRIWLTAERQGSDVVVSVKDQGIGIAADQLSRLFEMFSQLRHSLEKAQGGLGIGLTLVKRLVEMHGGSIAAKSDGPNKGSEFVVRLPVVVETSIAEQENARTDGDSRSSLRILVVDDNRDGADSLSMMLEMMGNETRTAYDGEEAVAAAADFRPHVILLDIGLPKLTGYEACRQIREHPGGREIVIIAQTGWGQEDDRQRTHEAGIDHHMVKPVDPQALMKMLAALHGAKT
jgi:PAS domain S-box-containing protein